MEEATTEVATEATNINWQGVLDTVVGWVMNTGIKIIIAILLLIISFRLITVITRRIEKRLIEKKHLDKTLTSTLFYILRIVLKIVVLTCLIGYLGIDTTGIAALIAALGVGIGLALNGALSNLAGGVIILVTRPFKIDDYIKSGDYEGTVEDIRIVFTKIRTVDNKVVYIPNGPLSSGSIVNFTEKELRRVDISYHIARSEDYKKAEEIMLGVADAHEKVLKDPVSTARVDMHTPNDTSLFLRAWVKSEDYWDVFFDLNENVKKALDEAGILMPVNQLDVRVKKD